MDKQVYIELMGQKGAGLTSVSKLLSEKLGVYLTSSDYYRSMLYLINLGYTESDFKSERAKRLCSYLTKMYPDVKECFNAKKYEKYVDTELDRTITNALKMDSSIIVDKHKIERGAPHLKVNDDHYDKITIFVESFDFKICQERLYNVSPNYDEIDNNVIGANMKYSFGYSPVSYNTPTLADAALSDYIIINNGTLGELNDRVEEVAQKIKKR